jgi:hypothetical protein
MADPPISSRNHPFPPLRPEVTIRESDSRIDAIDCRELRWWFAIPQVGDHTLWANYEIDTGELSHVTSLRATTPAKIHGIECVELQVDEWSADPCWPTSIRFVYGAIEPEQVRWIAVVSENDGTKVLSTFADDGFEDAWGAGEQRKLYDDERYALQPDGSYKITAGQCLGAGVYDVTVGGRTFLCLRVLDMTPDGGELVEACVEGGGRTVLFRRYDSRYYRGGDLVLQYPDNRRIVIDGVVYVHSDCTGRAHDVITSCAWPGTPCS